MASVRLTNRIKDQIKSKIHEVLNAPLKDVINIVQGKELGDKL